MNKNNLDESILQDSILEKVQKEENQERAKELGLDSLIKDNIEERNKMDELYQSYHGPVYEDGQPLCFQTIDTDKESYVGWFKEKELTGFGIYQNKNHSYIGEFVNGKRQGIGADYKMKLFDSIPTIGFYKNNKYQNEKKLHYKKPFKGFFREDSYYYGEFILDKTGIIPNGKGFFYFDVYDTEKKYKSKTANFCYGNFKNGELNGEGMFVKANLGYNNYGNSILYSKDGWKNNELDGECFYIEYGDNNALFYKGHYKNYTFYEKGELFIIGDKKQCDLNHGDCIMSLDFEHHPKMNCPLIDKDGNFKCFEVKRIEKN